MTTMTEERAQEPRRAISRPASGIAIDPERLIAWRSRRAMSRQDLEDAIEALGWTDERGKPVRYTRDAIAKTENRYRKPKPRTLKALCAALSTEDDPCTPLDLMYDGPPAQLLPAARKHRLRLDYNAGMRAYAEENGYAFRNPATGRVYYPRGLRVAYARHVLAQADAGLLGDDMAEMAREELREQRAQDGCERSGTEDPVQRVPRDPADLAPLVRPEDLLGPDAPVTILELPPRVTNCLKRDGIFTLRQLAALSRADLEGIRNLGAKGRDEIITAFTRLPAAHPAEPAQLAS
jgi:transcriptional regulator with XRE-family HTH domain/predicted flap endonuclease-1-like 5' DNA nuclease